MGFRLKDDLHYCVAGQRAIFLDVAADRYFTLPKSADGAFQRLVQGSPMGAGDQEALETLVEKGVLFPDVHATIGLPDFAVPRALHDIFPTGKSQAGAAALFTAVRMQIAASRMLRARGFAEIIAHLRASKPAALAVECSTHQPEIDRIAAAFRRTRFLFRPADRCLPRAIGFALCAYRVQASPMLVFGVRTNPFVAHCWLQSGDRIIHDDSGQATLFTPIMVV